jgi:hypothetical protein
VSVAVRPVPNKSQSELHILVHIIYACTDMNIRRNNFILFNKAVSKLIKSLLFTSLLSSRLLSSALMIRIYKKNCLISALMKMVSYFCEGIQITNTLEK